MIPQTKTEVINALNSIIESLHGVKNFEATRRTEGNDSESGTLAVFLSMQFDVPNSDSKSHVRIQVMEIPRREPKRAN